MKKIIFIINIFLIASFIYAEEWQVKESSKNSVKFISSTTLLDFEGNTSKIDGYLYWEGEKIFEENNELYFEVDLNSVETGNGKRDRDMREEVLETDKWQFTKFKGTITSFTKEESEEKYNVITKGKMFIHGKAKELEIPGVITFNGDEMNIQANFSVFLEDYNIEAPSLLAFIKVAEEIKLKLNFYLSKSK
jgi:polyisoprenoid-binding protein YceI